MKDSSFNMKIKIDKMALSQPYLTHLIVDKDQNISLKIFFDSTIEVLRTIMEWREKHDAIFSEAFEVVDIIEPDNLLKVDFSNTKYKRIEFKSTFIENDVHYLLIYLNEITKVYSNSDKLSSNFYLNDIAFNLVELNYKYKNNYFWNDEIFKWEPYNRISDFISFNKISFIPEHNFLLSKKDNEKDILIRKEPRLRVKYNNLSENEIIQHIKLICSLYSFYSQSTIDYSYSQIYTEDEVIIEIKDLEKNDILIKRGLFQWDFSKNPLNLILNIDIPHLLKNLTFTENIIKRFNFAYTAEGESKFMILYNILEQIRNEYILSKEIEKEKFGDNPNLNKVVEEYKFILSNTKRDKFLKEVLENVVEKIADDQKESFKNDIPNKLTPIKVLSMSNQFKSLFEHINIDPSQYNLKFDELLSLRNLIFHGRPVNEKLGYLNEVNTYDHLPKFVGMVVLKYFGITNLQNIKKIKI